MSDEWDSDIASLLDDVLNDKQPEVVEEVTTVVSSPDTPETPQPPAWADEPVSIPLSPEAQLAAMLEDDVVDDGTLAEEPPEKTLEGMVDKAVTTVVSDDPGDLTQEEHDACVQLHPKLSDGTGLYPEHAWAEGMTPQEYEAEKQRRCDTSKAALPPIDKSAFSTPVENEPVALPTFTTEELMAEIDVRNFGTLVSLSNRRWHAKVKDRKAAADAADATGAVKESFEARKRLLVGADEKLKAVHKCIDAARTDHYRMTLPWSTVGINDMGKRAGPRLLPNTSLFDYSNVMGGHKASMIDALDEFVLAYPTLIAIAQQKLQGSFNQSDYPPPAAIEQHFDLEFDFEPIPSGGDFQGLQDAQATKLSEALARKTRVRLENAMQDAWQRLYDTVERAVNALTNPDAMFHYTLVDALRENASILKNLNVINDSRIEEVRAAVEQELTKHDAKDVRKDDALRKRLGDAAKAIHAKMQEYAA